jgi:hypothetical protein
MNFISNLLKVKRVTSFFIVVDRFSKYAVFTSAPTSKVCSVDVVVELFYKNVVKYFGLLQNISNDHDMRFMGRLWVAFFIMSGSELKFSMANHLQIDG